MFPALLQEGSTGRWLRFGESRGVVIARSQDEVLPALREVESRVEVDRLHAVGFVSYEAAGAFDSALRVRARRTTGDPKKLPLLRFSLHDPPDLLPLPPGGRDPVALDWQPNLTRAAYDRCLAEIREHIARGDTYQVNYTWRLKAPFSGDPWDWFLLLARAQRARHGAWLDIGSHVIVSASPELFFRLEGRRIVARPMKGTAPRACTSTEDDARGEELRTSAKNRAENIMIVDMMRNDLGRIAVPGSVRVPRLFDLERYPTVWQMTSTVEAETDRPLSEIFRALFPPASVTGAPKASTMGIIADLETEPRGIYTGAIGHLAPGRRAEFNVAIRTLVFDLRSNIVEYGTGGGIVWDSSAESEYAECLDKARVLQTRWPSFSLLETLRWDPEGGYLLLDGHLERLEASARYFGFPCDPRNLRSGLDSLAAGFPRESHRIRALLDEDGSLRFEAALLRQDTGTPWADPQEKSSRTLAATQGSFVERTPAGVRTALACAAVDSSSPFLYHKTTHREVYDRALAARPGFDEVILWNERGELTEATRSNLVVDLDGALCTPPVSSGLLAGTFRRRLIEAGTLSERLLRREDLERARAVWLVNSVRGWRRAILAGEESPTCAS